jgi:hypothetical protein
MLIAHPLVKTRTPPRTTDVADEGVANDSREPVPPPCGTLHDSDDSLADSNGHIRAQSQPIVKDYDIPTISCPFKVSMNGDLRAATGGIQR